MSAEGKPTFLPNMVGGVSIWKLADNLNQDRFFDGRLIAPETEGSESLPVKVSWHVDHLVPLDDARAQDPEGVEKALADFIGCVERARAELSDPKSGFHKFRDALTMPSLGSGEAADAKNYFYDKVSKKLFVINWGASSRNFAGQSEVVFGYDRWDELVRGAQGFGGKSAKAGVAVGDAKVAGPDGPGDPKKAVDKKDDEPRKKSPWFWLVIALAVVVLVVLLGLLFQDCQSPPEDGTDAGTDAGLDAGDAGEARDAADASDAADDADDADDAGDAGDAGDDAGDAGRDAGEDAGDAGKDAGGDGGTADNSGTPPENGKVYIIVGGGGGGSGPPNGKPKLRPTTPIPFRAHFQPGATAWRISGGSEVVSDQFPPTMNEGAFEVYLDQGHTFSEIDVEWKDKGGTWHKH